MIALKQILVATDFGDASAVALVYGRALARTFGASLHLLHVMENMFLRPVPVDPYQMRAAIMQRLVDRLTDEDRTLLRATAVLETSDNAAAEIVEYSKAHDIDLIVMGTHGRAAVERFLVGSVAERVVRTAPCPVFTVRHPEHEFVVPDAGETSANRELGGLP